MSKRVKVPISQAYNVWIVTLKHRQTQAISKMEMKIGWGASNPTYLHYCALRDLQSKEDGHLYEVVSIKIKKTK